MSSPARAVPTAVLVALCLVLSSCSSFGADDDEGAGVGTTSDTDAGESANGDDPDTTATSTTTETTAPPIVDLTEAAWVINDFDGLVDDQGRTVAPAHEIPGAARPTVARADDGSIYYILDGKLWKRAVDATEPDKIETEAAEISGVDHDGDGNIIVNPYGDSEIVAAASATTERSNNILGESGDLITATNGITVRVSGPDADVEGGYITEFRSPAQIEVERDGDVEWTIDAGGVRAPWLSLVDFDGRFVMMARYPTEPADPMMQHIVYDLDCRTGDAAGSGCTRTFWARWGTASLVGPDLAPGDNELNTVLLDVCPTMSMPIEPPAEMTDPDSFDEDFNDADLEAFRLTALQVATCDPLGLGDPTQPGLDYVSGGDDPRADGWMWTELARALRGPFTAETEETWVWARHPDGPRAVLTNNFGESYMDLLPGRQFPEAVAVTATSEAILIVGRTDAETADAVEAAAQAVAENRGARLTNRIDPSGPAHPDDLVGQFTDTIESTLGDEAVIGEVHLTADGVTSRTYDGANPTAAETALGFAMADFSSGGEGVYDELPLANEVALALGSEVLARRRTSELFRRSAWAVNSADYAGRVGPFNILNAVPSPSEIVVGPHPRCAGMEASPAPSELASFTRIGVLPLEGSIDSCLEWSAVDLYVDDEGVIHGVSLQLEEP